MALNVIMMGPPGAGKGTQAARFARERTLLKISTGDILREAVKENNPTALQAKAKMDRGELVDDDTMIAIVAERLTRPDAARGFVLDGFPRTVAQAQALDEIMERRGCGPAPFLPSRKTRRPRRLQTRHDRARTAATRARERDSIAWS